MVNSQLIPIIMFITCKSILRVPVLSEWNSTGKRPKNLQTLVRCGGIPEALRCQLWQKLSKTEERADLSDQYRLLITKESKCEDIIMRDVHRTFPAHELFREKSGFGQESLYKVSRAYSVYDTGTIKSFRENIKRSF